MSSFLCPKCMTAIIDTPEGYITFCQHYPEEKKCNCTFGSLIELGFPLEGIVHSKNCSKYYNINKKKSQ